MPKYQIEIPGKGTFQVESDRELSDSEAYNAALQHPESSTQPAKSGSLLGFAKDLITGKMVPGNYQPASENLEAAGNVLKKVPRAIADVAPEAIAGTAGYMAGTALGGPAAPLLAPAMGGGASMLVGALHDLYKQHFQGEAPPGLIESTARALARAGGGAMPVKPSVKSATIGTPEEDAAIQYALRENIPIDAATATNSQVLSGVRSGLRNLPISGSIQQRASEKTQQALIAKGKELAQVVAPKGTTSEFEAGAGIAPALQKKIGGIKGIEEQAYEKLDRVAQQHIRQIQVGQTVTGPAGFPAGQTTTPIYEKIAGPTDISQVKTALQPIYDEISKSIPVVQQDASPGFQALKQLMNSKDVIGFKEARNALSSIMKMSREADNPLLRDRAQGIAAATVGPLRDAIDDAATSMGVKPLLTAARSLTKGRYEVGDLRRLLTGPTGEKEPVRVFQNLVANEDRSIKALTSLQKESPDSIPDIARATIEGVLKDATNATGQFSGAAASNSFKKLGDQTKQILFGQNQKNLEDFFALARITQREANPSGSGRVAILAGQIAYTFKDPISGVSLMAGEAALSKALSSPTIARLLNQSIRGRLVIGSAKALGKSLIALGAERAGEQQQ